MIRALLCGLLMMLGAAKGGAQCTAVITGPSSFCTGGSATLTASTSTTCTASYQWYYSSTGATYTTTGSASSTNTYAAVVGGYFKVTITYGGTCGCTVTSNPVQITVNPTPSAPTFTSSNPLSVCPGGTALICVNTCSGCSYNLAGPFSGAPATGSTGCFAIPGIAPANAGSYIVTRSSAGCTSAPSTITVVTLTPPPAPTTFPVSYCQDATATALTAVGTNLQWWATATSATPLIVPPTGIIPSTTTPGTTTYWVSQIGMCTSPRASLPVTVIATPARPVASGNTPVCAGDTLFLGATSTAVAPTYSWTGPNGFSDTVQHPVVLNVTAADSGVYKVRANDSGCLSLPDSVIVSVTCLDSVWAGDVNYDNTADYLDALEIALNLGATGPARAGTPSIAWQAAHCANWASSLTSYASVNGKHADCDGDGTVAYSDTLAVTANYGLTHPKGVHNATAKALGLPDLYFDLSGIVPTPGNALSVPIMLGSATLPMQAIAGIAARIKIEGITPTDTPSMSFTGSWLGTAGSTLRFAKGINNNSVDWVYARTDRHNNDGYGIIGHLTFTPPPGSEGQRMKLYFEDVVIVDSSGTKLSDYNLVDDSIAVTPLGLSPAATPSFTLAVLPNPSAGASSARLSLPAATRYTLQVRDLSGKLLWQQTREGSHGYQYLPLPTRAIGSGIYIVSLRTEAWPGVVQVKWVKAD